MSDRIEKDFIPYGKHCIDEGDIEAVVNVLKSGWLTTGPEVARFEDALKDLTQAKHVMALSNGTAALHAVAHALNLRPDDEVIVPTITFAATANAVVYVGAKPVFADVRFDDMLLDPEDVKQKITKRTKAIFAVDFAGQACDYNVLREIADEYGLALVSDSCHAIGATYQGKPVAQWADMTIFSFHPVKNICAGEGGAVATNP